jgi:hypothetical protein
MQRVPGDLSLGVKRPGREADHLPPSVAEVKNAWRYTSTPNTPSLRGTALSQTRLCSCSLYFIMSSSEAGHVAGMRGKECIPDPGGDVMQNGHLEARKLRRKDNIKVNHSQVSCEHGRWMELAQCGPLVLNGVEPSGSTIRDFICLITNTSISVSKFMTTYNF